MIPERPKATMNPGPGKVVQDDYKNERDNELNKLMLTGIFAFILGYELFGPAGVLYGAGVMILCKVVF